MVSDREIRNALPGYIPYYSFHGDRVAYNGEGCPTPGRNFLDPKQILVRVYNATIAPDGGFSGEVISIGDHVDSVGVNEYVFGGGMTCLQQYITVRAEEVCTKARDLCFADASRLHAGTLLWDSLRHLQPDSTVLILGDMTGFATQICRELGCFVTSSEDFGCDESNIIDSDNFLEWLENHDFIFDVVVDATGDLDIYDHCHKFTTKRAEYISINPESAFQAIRASYLPSVFGGGTRKLTVVRPATGPKKGQLLAELSRKVLKGVYEVKNPRIISYRSVSTVHTVMRYVTAVNVIEQKDITPEDPEYNMKEEALVREKSKGKGKAKSRSFGKSTRPVTPEKQHKKGATSIGSDASPSPSPKRPNGTSQYSPKVHSRLSHSISASALPELSPSPTQTQFEAIEPIPQYNHNTVTKPLVTPDRGGSSSPKLSILSRPPTSSSSAARRYTNDMAPLDSNSPFEQIELRSIARRSAVVGDSSGSEADSDDSVSPPLSRQYIATPGGVAAEESESDVDSDNDGRRRLIGGGAARISTGAAKAPGKAEHHRATVVKTALAAMAASSKKVHTRSGSDAAKAAASAKATAVKMSSSPSYSDENGDVSEVDLEVTKKNSNDNDNKKDALKKEEELSKAQQQIEFLQKQVESLMASQNGVVTMPTSAAAIAAAATDASSVPTTSLVEQDKSSTAALVEM